MFAYLRLQARLLQVFQLPRNRLRNDKLSVGVFQALTQQIKLILKSTKSYFEHFLLLLAVHSASMVEILIFPLQSVLSGQSLYFFAECVALFIRLNGDLPHFD